MAQDLSFSKTLNPSHNLLLFRPLKPFLCYTPKKTSTFCHRLSPSLIHSLSFCSQKDGTYRRDIRAMAGRSKKKSEGQPSGWLEETAGMRRDAKRNARIKSKKLAESLFYRLKNPNSSRSGSNHPDNFTEEELEMIGLGYDRMVRFMEKDDPNLRHPYDWYKYGEFGPYSWRGVVVGDPVRGRLSDECVTMFGEVRNHEEWEKIEQHEMATDYGKRVKQLDKSIGFRYYWVFARHPKWRINEFPWQQWTLISEVVLEAGKQRLDKWSLMGRLGNKSRSLISQCAAWYRPDIIYVKKPVFQCRFEPQDNFFNAIVPFLDPKTEKDFLFEVTDDEGRVEMCTYFGGLCKIVKVRQKAFVDDVVNAYEKLSDEKKSKCLEFLLTNHPVQLLHPYTREWKAKLEEIELGCDAPDEDEGEYNVNGNAGKEEFTDWIEDDDGEEDNNDDNNDEEDDAVIVDEEGNEDDVLGAEEEDLGKEEDEKYWEEEFRKAVSSADKMEMLVRRSMEISNRKYESQLKGMEAAGGANEGTEEEEETVRRKGNLRDFGDDGDELAMRGKRAKVDPPEWKMAGYGKWRKRVKKSKIPPELFLRAAVRPFTYRNLVKEIVLTRHAIVEEDGKVESSSISKERCSYESSKEELRRKKIGLANKGRVPWNKGRKHTKEARMRIRQRTIEALRDPKVKSSQAKDVSASTTA